MILKPASILSSVPSDINGDIYWHWSDSGDADSLVYSCWAHYKIMLRVLFCFYFPFVERFLIIKCQKTNRLLTYVSQFMYLISCILDSSVTLSRVIYPFLPRALGQVHWYIYSFTKVLLEVQNIQCILQGTREIAIYTTDRWYSCGEYIFLKKQMLFK